MSGAYSVETCEQLTQRFYDTRVHRPLNIERYDPGTRLLYEATPVSVETERAHLHLEVERFVGGGFAGQVYRVKVLDVSGGELPGVTPGGVYALKLLIPPSGFSLFFRNMLYALGFQGAFQQQCNPAAARAGALWQKFIRRAAAARFDDEGAVNDVHATVVDEALGSCGELSNWVDGRTWRLEVDDRLDHLARWERGQSVDESSLGSAEYRAKKRFMREFVALLHEMGAHEFARQYEWWTCKSQPNCLKRHESDGAEAGLVAVDFRAGLALLPFLPMSPGDILLILQGLLRGSLVQFDRGNVAKLEAFVARHSEVFDGMGEMLGELKRAEDVYRHSVPDITHNHLRLLYSTKLWSIMADSAVTGWHVRNLIDSESVARFRGNPLAILLFSLLGLIPFLGRFPRRVWGHQAWRRHYGNLFTNVGYLLRALQARRYEATIRWHRAQRLDSAGALRVSASPLRFMLHLPLSILPPGIHRFLTDGQQFRQRLHDIFIHPIKLYFDAALREQWLRDMVEEGRRKYIVSDEDARQILGSIKEPFIQKYLKSLAVHVCTLPVTQVVSLLIAGIAVLTHPEWTKAEAATYAAGIILAFQVVPISPGSLARGLYVLYVVIRERNFKDYNIAVFLGFFKYVGYLAFPIQMTYRYPALARFMAGHWATEAVHIVPVFGERGALLEHWAFNLFYNWPLTVRRRVGERMERRARLKPRRWPTVVYALLGAVVLTVIQYAWWYLYLRLPALDQMGWALAGVAALAGGLTTLSAGGLGLGGRVVSAALGGMALGALSMAGAWFVGVQANGAMLVPAHALVSEGIWRAFIATILSAIGAVVTELMLPAPTLSQQAENVA